METYRRQSFQGRSFVMEEAAFLECKLIDCDLFYSGGDFEFVNTNFENCRFHWRGAAKNTVALLQAVGMIPMPAPPRDLSAPGPKPN